ncbi:MAG: DEAD/DEAH box helicase family protein, partial [Candidatus Methanomethylophilaceae archaeon]|nr:DEAD/DEAH box helicase family protein [Candidatus Methanomethylophilaceae archaeon]
MICDEAHHAVAKQYNCIIEYFRPKFMLGMTATPERMDSGDVFKKFNHNIAYEIRLQDALEKNMLCPFHYYGITDISVNGRPIEDDEDFNSLVSEERIKHIIEKMEFYGHSGDRVKGLIFCRSIEEGRELSVKLNEHGLRTQFVCGKDD